MTSGGEPIINAESVLAFARKLKAEVDASVQSGIGKRHHAEEFTRIALEKLGNEGALENPILLWQEGTFEAQKYKIAGFALADDEDRLLLVTTVHTGAFPPRPLSNDEISTALKQALRFYEASCSGMHKAIAPANTDAGELARRIFDLRARGRIGVLRLVIISDGIVPIAPLDIRRTSDNTRVIVNTFDIEQLFYVLHEGLTNDDIVIDFLKELGQPLPCLKASFEGTGYDAYLAVVPASILGDTYEKYGSRLLEHNVRAFLGVRGRETVNAGIRKTILEVPSSFLALNNGVVAIADEIDLAKSTAGTVGIRSLRGFQIVNGGQTTASLHRAKRLDAAKLDGIMVAAKIIKVERDNFDSMVAAVSLSANSQNTVQPADFSANDPFHIALERLANDTWLSDGQSRWFYERARGAYAAFGSDIPVERRFTKADVAKYLNAWDGFPYYVSSGNQKNFHLFMQRLKEEHPAGLQPDADWYKAFVAKAIVFRATQSIVQEKQFLAYEDVIVAYTVAILSWETHGVVDFDLLWSRQAISPEFAALIGECAGQIERALRVTAQDRMLGEWAKTPECWDRICATELDIQLPIPPELRETPAGPNEQPEGRQSAGAGKFVSTRDELICSLRQVLAETAPRSREDVIAALQASFPNTQSREDLDSVIRTALRRYILESRGDRLALATRSIIDYKHEFLRDQFLASMQGRGWIERDESVWRFAIWLGFRRASPFIDGAARSVISGLIRDGRLEARGSLIRYAAQK
ncbi:MAG TPA: AIPR family protein [Xanthobacteraceae bacterium]|nr:AIPR family protein [Xanthobacteraceae bacterium]